MCLSFGFPKNKHCLDGKNNLEEKIAKKLYIHRDICVHMLFGGKISFWGKVNAFTFRMTSEPTESPWFSNTVGNIPLYKLSK